MSQEALREIGSLYARIPELTRIYGHLTPEFMLENSASLIAQNTGMEGYPRYCDGAGSPHIWLDAPTGKPFETRCELHSEKVKKKRKP